MASLKTVSPDIGAAQRLVLKIGSALLIAPGCGLRHDWLKALALDVTAAKARGADVILVSSGSIALGCAVLGLPQNALTLEQSQAAAAVGQMQLARAYEEVLAPHGITAAQILVTLDDTQDRRRYLNTRATLEALLSMGAVPIVNENDTVATDENRFGDNDQLAAQIAVTVGADQLILLSDVDGFYSANPQKDPNARRFDVISNITPEIEAMAGDPVSTLSKGGMKTKLLAARTALAGGCAMAIMHGSMLRPLQALANGAARTWFVPKGDPQQARKSWINAMKPRGRVMLDTGATAALYAGKSLLSAGVTRVDGSFERGDAVTLCGPDGAAFGKGLAGYKSLEARAIAGHRSADIESILGYAGRAALIHRDDLVLLYNGGHDGE